MKAATLTELLRRRALQQPDQRAYTFLIDGEVEGPHLTYAELDRQARAIAARLQPTGEVGERVLLLYPPGLEFISAFFGCLYSGRVAVPAYPPRLNRNLLRIQAISIDAQATKALTTSAVLSRIEPFFDPIPELKRSQWLCTDTAAEDGDDWREPAGVSRDSLAFIQYTSGSTGTPKGVMLTHRNLLHNASLIYDVLEHTPDDKYLSWLPTFHDMGFMAGILEPLYGGIPSVLMSPFAFLQRPLRWLKAISRYGATTSGGPNFAYELCVRKVSPEQRETLDLSSWSAAFNGAEPVRSETLERFVEAYEPYGFRRETFYPCYGLAEATLMVSGGSKALPPVVRSFYARTLENNRAVDAAPEDVGARSLVGCGRTLSDQKIVIARPDTAVECEPGEVGEIWVKGDSVAKGYWNRPAETEQTLHAHLKNNGEGPFLRTGDLGFLKDGELFVTGRLKDLVIINGHNHYPQDIERTAEESHPALRPSCTAAFSIDVSGEERVVVAAEVDPRYRPGPGPLNAEADAPEARRPSLDAEEVIKAIRRAVAEDHELQVYAVVLLKAGTIPKTSSGKIQRHACRNGYLRGTLEAWGDEAEAPDFINLRPSDVAPSMNADRA